MQEEKARKEKKNEIAIVQRNDPILRKKTKPVDLKEIGSTKIKKIISDMKKALSQEQDGVAIAAPQIGVDLSIFVVSKKVFHLLDEKNVDGKVKYMDITFINPRIIKLSKTKKLMEEGCLSVRYAYGKVPRADRATIEAYDEDGNKFTRGAGGLLAQIFQHETDHLNGVLFTDTASNVEEISEAEYKKLYEDANK
jgi:peptide deformylase